MAFIGTVYKLDGISHVKVKLDWRQSLDSETVQSSGMKKKKKSHFLRTGSGWRDL